MIIGIIGLVATLLVSVAMHEAAHAIALRKLGIPISHAGLGMHLPPMLQIPPRGRREFTLTLSPWLVGAYVLPDERYDENIERLPYRDHAWVLNVGIITNLILGFALLAPGYAMGGRPVAGVVAAALAVACWYGRRALALYVVPALAPVVLVTLIAALAMSWAEGSTGVGYAGLGAILPDGGVAQHLQFAGVVSLAIGLFNAAPLFGLDNGKVIGLLLGKWFGPTVLKVYSALGAAFLITLLLLAIGSDLWAIGKAVFSAVA